jgi:hypothetical protein
VRVELGQAVRVVGVALVQLGAELVQLRLVVAIDPLRGVAVGSHRCSSQGIVIARTVRPVTDE